MRTQLLIGVLAAALSACGSSPKLSTTTSEPAPLIRPTAEVQRLRALADQNVALAAWSGPYGGVPPWDQITAASFAPAFELGLALLAAEVDAIATNPEPATFANTLAALEDAGRHQDRAQTLFGVWTSNLSTPEVQAVEREWAPKISEAYDKIVFNPQLFARIEALHAAGDAGLTAEQRRLVDRSYDRFVRAGARLTPEQKQRLGEINQALAVAFTDFSNKLLADEQTWITLEASDLDGLSESLRSAYKAAAVERKLPDKWVVTNTRSSVDPFLAASARRDLREKVWRAFKNRGDNNDANDTAATIAQIVKLRVERAALVGSPSHAHWRMADTMAVDPKKAMDLMMRVWPAAVARVREEVADMQAIANQEGAKLTIEPWDYLHYAGKVRKAKYALDQDEIKPYFELNNMTSAAFFMAEQLYGLMFTEITGKVPVFHPEVRVWEVTSKDTGAYVGLFYGDYFARPGKRSGAWAQGYQGRESFTGRVITPITSNNNNFVRGGAGEPVLISLDDARTLFHEFGHALHGLLSEVTYPGLARTPRDYVEYPSQVHEQWVLTRPILDRFAKHYRTGAPMPQALVDKIEASSKFNQGYTTVEYLSSALLDMEIHVSTNGTFDPKTFEAAALKRLGMPKEMAMRHRLPQFGHLFSSDAYSAGYYSYLWSEVMDADTREAFAEAGDVFDKATADKLRKFILAPGNTTDRAEAYRQFRGRDPDVKALLKKRGFPIPN
ncbi:MAG: M3 family metallopeptidase [Kofleriaceae bacterium]